MNHIEIMNAVQLESAENSDQVNTLRTTSNKDILWGNRGEDTYVISSSNEDAADRKFDSPLTVEGRETELVGGGDWPDDLDNEEAYNGHLMPRREYDFSDRSFSGSTVNPYGDSSTDASDSDVAYVALETNGNSASGVQPEADHVPTSSDRPSDQNYYSYTYAYMNVDAVVAAVESADVTAIESADVTSDATATATGADAYGTEEAAKTMPALSRWSLMTALSDAHLSNPEAEILDEAAAYPSGVQRTQAWSASMSTQDSLEGSRLGPQAPVPRAYSELQSSALMFA